MTEHLSIPRAELEALLSKLENSQLDYAERVGRAQGYLDKWLMTAHNCKKCGEAHPRRGHWPDRLCTDCYKAEREPVAHCANCGKETPPAMLSAFELCPGCYYRCRCLDVPGDNPRCDVHGQKSAEPATDAVRDLIEDLAHGPVGFSVADMHIYEEYIRGRAEKLLKADKPAPPTGDTCQMSAAEHAAAADAALKDAIKQRLVTR